ncbi:hypothetical protein H4R18_003080 [Coemansia javaensis]|uniref:Uncharacterized protein n=1 Tax=Coemansia javaensis TaxID=2761396 RepID=A0A9W8LHV1_9FUNG|nr:hypothetical protein H4R18_003080 [Coemansia javaensis]
MKFSIIAAAGFACAAMSPGAAATAAADCPETLNIALISYLNAHKVGGGGGVCSVGAPGTGYVAGIGAFTTQYGSALDVIKAYKAGGSYRGVFDQLLPTLETYAAQSSGSTAGLDSFCAAWEAASANGQAFRAAQVSVIRSKFEEPALQLAASLGVRFELTKSLLLDTALVNGLAGTNGGLAEIIAATNNAFTASQAAPSGSALTIGNLTVDEAQWIQSFLDARTAVAPGRALDHIAAYRSLLAGSQFAFADRISFTDATGRGVTIACPGKCTAHRRR